MSDSMLPVVYKRQTNTHNTLHKVGAAALHSKTDYYEL